MKIYYTLYREFQEAYEKKSVCGDILYGTKWRNNNKKTQAIAHRMLMEVLYDALVLSLELKGK